jgi:hypothetical protein
MNIFDIHSAAEEIVGSKINYDIGHYQTTMECGTLLTTLTSLFVERGHRRGR